MAVSGRLRQEAPGVRIAVVSDIHGNLTALEAVIAQVQDAAPDLVLHGGDIADGGSSPAEVVDRLRDLGWAGVMGNGDEMLVRPQALEDFAAHSAAPPQLWEAVRTMASATRDRLGPDRLAWLGSLPPQILLPKLALVHATPASCWHAAPPAATDAELAAIYGPLERETVVYGHTHVPGSRVLESHRLQLINAGSAGLPFDGDPRASFLLLTDGLAEIRRVPYDVDRECARLASSGLPGAEWTATMLRVAAPRLP